MQGYKFPVAVEEGDVLGAVSAGRWVDLELKQEAEEMSRRDLAEGQLEIVVLARLVRRGRFDRVERHPLQPIRVEHEARVLDVAVRGHTEARLVHQSGAYPARHVDLQRARCRSGL